MSINAAVAALDKEIQLVDKRRARLGTLREALVAEGDQVEDAVEASAPAKGKPGPKPGAKKGKPGPKPGAAKKGKPGPKPSLVTKGRPGPKPGAAKKATTLAPTATANKTATPKKRVVSPEVKKKMSDSAKARWAAKSASKKAV
jgi:hypothetical protein